MEVKMEHKEIVEALQLLLNEEVELLIGSGMTRIYEQLQFDKNLSCWGLRWNGGTSQVWFKANGVLTVRDNQIFITTNCLA
jgi:hypothetical protein